MRLDPNAFNTFVAGIGQSFLWRKSYACPCVNPQSGAAKPKCKRCAGKGRTWDAAIVSRAGVPGASSMKRFEQFGILDAGDLQLVIPSDQPMYAMGQFDRVVMVERTEPFSMNLLRGVNDGALRFPVVSIDRVFWLDAAENEVNGVPPDVLADGTLSWGANPPPSGITYSLTGRRQPEYFCYLQLPHDRPEHFGEPLPRRALLRRFDLFGR